MHLIGGFKRRGLDHPELTVTGSNIGGNMTLIEFLSVVEFAQHELLLLAAIGILIAAADDILIDIIWTIRWAYRRVVYYRKRAPMRSRDLPQPNRSGTLAVFVAAWDEADVIGDMLKQCHKAWHESATDYLIYVGCYPNDLDSVKAVQAAAEDFDNIRPVLLPHHGPTTKADCLNHVWRQMAADELDGGYKIKAVVLHDAEDCPHCDELSVFDRLIEKCMAVQLPVIPVRVPGSIWVSGHYCDEFAEAHAKSLVVREAVGAAIPLAGVACAIDRNFLGRIAIQRGSGPFDQATLTEDYELGLHIGESGGRVIMARLLDGHGDLVGTRACFPHTINTSVRQKSRWLTGIALAGWDRLGWRGSISEMWMRIRDRRSTIAAIILMIAYGSMILTGILAIAQLIGVYTMSPVSPLLGGLLTASLIVLVWRMLTRALFVGHLYGVAEGLLSIPRVLVANIIAMLAARKAIVNYTRHCFGMPLTWDKTRHHVVPTTSRNA